MYQAAHGSVIARVKKTEDYQRDNDVIGYFISM
jgi:hypothetical protein